MLKTYEVKKQIDHGSLILSEHKVFRFPGGESHIDFKPRHSIQVAQVQGADGSDLMDLAMWADACRRSPVVSSTLLVLPYLPGARMDRGAPLGAKVYADFVNSLGIDTVVCIDPHSDVAPALYDRLVVYPLENLHFWNTFQGSWDAVIAPDLGARKRAEAVAGKLGIPVIQAQKHRDFATGKLSGFTCESVTSKNAKFLLVDDICDGGGTFNGLADYLFEQGVQPSQLDLWVTHGIFSQGLDELSKRFSHIYTTDSHNNVENNFMGDVKITRLLHNLTKFAIPGM